MFQSQVERVIEQIEVMEMALAEDLSDDEVEELLEENAAESETLLQQLNFH